MEWENLRRHGKQFESEERLDTQSLTSAASTSDLSFRKTAFDGRRRRREVTVVVVVVVEQAGRQSGVAGC